MVEVAPTLLTIDSESQAPSALARPCVVGSQHGTTIQAGASPSPKQSATKVVADSKSTSSWQLVFCVLGLQASYVTWGYVQEKVMTKEYKTGRFPSAGFCVFSNRICAVVVASGVTLNRHKSLRTNAPIWSFAPCSVSNSLSSFAQYQALRYVSFPLQTLSKSTKVIPVMLMGKVLNKKSYSWREYAEAIVISAGMGIFCYNDGSVHTNRHTEMLGVCMLFMYVAFDSFTSQWQSRVYKAYPSVDQFQMMLAVNSWSFLLTLGALIASNELLPTMAFLVSNPDAIGDNLTIAVTSATGQVFIFYTIKTFGPVVFTLTMATRQIISLVLSAVLFGHRLGPLACLGAVMIFSTAIWKVGFRKERSPQVANSNKD